MSFVLAYQVGQIVRDGHVQLVDRTPSEVRARLGQLLELVHGVQTEKVPVHVRVGQIVSGYVGQGAEPFVDVIVLRVLDDVVADGFLVAEERLVIVVRGQITVHHFRVVSHSHLNVNIALFTTGKTAFEQDCRTEITLLRPEKKSLESLSGSED